MKTTQQFNIFPTLGLKHHLQEIQFINGFSTIPRACPNFQNISSFFGVEFSLKELFNIQYLLHPRSTHHQITLSSSAHLLIKGFPMVPRASKGHHGLGDLM
jgi:hypothetical protein